MEQPQRRLSENNPMLVCRFDAFIVHDTPQWRSEIPHAAPTRAVHVVWEWEESIAGAGHAVQLPRVLRAFLVAERRGDLVEQALPVRLFSAVQHFATNEKVYRVRLVRALNSFLERECQHARVVAQPPIVRLGACEARAVNARLLPGAQSDCRPVVRIRHAVRLGVLQGQRCDDQVGDGALRKLVIWRGYLLCVRGGK